MMEKEVVLNQTHSRHTLLWLIIIFQFSLLFFSAFSAEITARKILKDKSKKSPKVRLEKTDEKVIINNGIVEVTIEKPTGHLLGIKYNGIDNVLETKNDNDNRGYWDIVWDHDMYDKLATRHVIIITESDELVELSFTRVWNKTKDHDISAPVTVDKRYIVRRGVPGVYMYGIFKRRKYFPHTYIHQLRIVFKLKEDKFHFMALSDTQQRIMPRREDREHSHCQVLAYPEAVLLTNPINPKLKGEVDDKYQYSIESKDNKLHGWIADHDAVGFWMITPSDEFRTGGPHKQDLTSHVGPTALSMFVSNHYMGKDIAEFYKEGVAWKKAFGPVLIYLNSATFDHAHRYRKSLWKDAKKRLSKEIKSWPYSFAASKDYPHADHRGEVSGQLQVRDKYLHKQLMKAKSAFVGLAAPGRAGSWQTEGKGYQFWTQTDRAGHFSIKNVRRGKYNLYAWVHGFIGNYKLDRNVSVHPGHKKNLGTLIYDPPRSGPTLWEIGIPDRTAAEFFIPDPNPTFVNSILNHEGEKFRQYGLWDRYSDTYPHHDLVFKVGASNYSRDWFFAHVPRRTGNDTKATTWKIKFKLQEVKKSGKYTLQMALAAANFAEVQVRINTPDGSPHFTTNRIGYDNAVARHGIHGLYRLYSINVPGKGLRGGNNTIFLTQTRCKDEFMAVMYDYIRLEGPAV